MNRGEIGTRDVDYGEGQIGQIYTLEDTLDISSIFLGHRLLHDHQGANLEILVFSSGGSQKSSGPGAGL